MEKDARVSYSLGMRVFLYGQCTVHMRKSITFARPFAHGSGRKGQGLAVKVTALPYKRAGAFGAKLTAYENERHEPAYFGVGSTFHRV